LKIRIKPPILPDTPRKTLNGMNKPRENVNYRKQCTRPSHPKDERERQDIKDYRCRNGISAPPSNCGDPTPYTLV